MPAPVVSATPPIRMSPRAAWRVVNWSIAELLSATSVYSTPTHARHDAIACRTISRPRSRSPNTDTSEEFSEFGPVAKPDCERPQIVPSSGKE